MRFRINFNELENDLRPAAMVGSADQLASANKRVPSGFVGMRGKKWSSTGKYLYHNNSNTFYLKHSHTQVMYFIYKSRLK